MQMIYSDLRTYEIGFHSYAGLGKFKTVLFKKKQFNVLLFSTCFVWNSMLYLKNIFKNFFYCPLSARSPKFLLYLPRVPGSLPDRYHLL